MNRKIIFGRNYMDIKIRSMDKNDVRIISDNFKLQGWNKPIETYQRYFSEQENGEREILIAEIDSNFAGYITIKWKSNYSFFLENNIPEIMDFNVLIKYRRMGIGNKLIDTAEDIIKDKSNLAGIGVGLYSDYGAAHILYVRRGYIPDGKGIYKNNSLIKYGESVIIDDDVVLYFIKKLN
jgi:ribosomal protein S18 acetylase RimI-like enzyme